MILHDIGKNDVTGAIETRYTLKENLGHIVIMDEEITACEEIGKVRRCAFIKTCRAHHRNSNTVHQYVLVLEASIAPYRLIRCDDYNDQDTLDRYKNQAHSQSVYSVE